MMWARTGVRPPIIGVPSSTSGSQIRVDSSQTTRSFTIIMPQPPPLAWPCTRPMVMASLPMMAAPARRQHCAPYRSSRKVGFERP